jgi:hypothetical protein
MATTTTHWVGGTTAVKQITSVTVANTWAASDTLTTTLTSEDGSTTETVTSTATGSDIETDVVDVHIVDLNNSVKALFAGITWDKNGTTKVRGTADVAGVPFYIAGSETTAGDGTYGSAADDTANAGPTDWNTLGNWINSSGGAGTIPTAQDTLRILPHNTHVDVNGKPVSYDIRYGLDQSSIDITSLRFSKEYRGVVGSPSESFYLQIDCTFGTAITIIESQSPSIWLKGSHDAIHVVNLPHGKDALHLSGGTIATLRLLGPAVRGKVTVADSSVVTTLNVFAIAGPVKIGTSGTAITLAEIAGASDIEINRAITTINSVNCTITKGAGAVSTWNNRGAYVYYNGTGTITNLLNYAGTFDFTQNGTYGCTVTISQIYSGLITDRSGSALITYSAAIDLYGGEVSSATAGITYKN